MMILNSKKEEIEKKLRDENLSTEDREILKSDIYQENAKVKKTFKNKIFFR